MLERKMAYANQPSRLLISSDDLDYGVGNNFGITLPEAITGAERVDLARAVIPNTGYNIPPYQANFYFVEAGSLTVQALVLNTEQYFDSITGGLNPLLTALNNTAISQGLNIVFSYDSATSRISVAGTPAGSGIRLAYKGEWPTTFALNTRLGFSDINPTPSVIPPPYSTLPVVGNFMPNLIRSKVIYVLCNVVMNDSISTDGLRTAIAKIPVNSTYGGLTIYAPPYLNFNHLVPSNSYQSIQISLLDDQYQPYPLNTEEFCELEIMFKYRPNIINA